MSNYYLDIHHYRSIINSNIHFKRKFHILPRFANCLFLNTELKSHMGCVNCLEWSRKGDILMSGSDDRQIILWSVERNETLIKISTFHEGNIFSVKFLAEDESIIASGAADSLVQVHQITNSHAQHIQTFKCHIKSVNTMENDRLNPNVFYSGSEDGFLRRFDIRNNHSDCSEQSRCDTEFITFNGIGIYSLKINPMNPYMMAIGCTDTIVRLYDIRKPDVSVACLLPLHSIKWDRKFDHLCPSMTSNLYDYYVTSVAFTSDGNELLANINGDNIFLYDINNLSSPKVFSVLPNIDDNLFNKIKVYKRYKTLVDSSCCTKEQLIEKSPTTSFNSKNFDLLWQEICHKTSSTSHSSIKDINQLEKLLNLLQDRFKRGTYFELLNKKEFNDIFNRINKRNWTCDSYMGFKLVFYALNYCEKYNVYETNIIKSLLKLMITCLFHDRRYKETIQTIEDYKNIFCEDLCDEISLLYNECRNNLNGINLSYSFPEDRSDVPIIDFKRRFIGACNNATIIKQANFFGDSDSLIVAGSDCGRFMIWDKSSSELLASYMADSSVVNCVLPRPNNPYHHSDNCLASSGIDNHIRIWSLSDDPGNNPATCEDISMTYANDSEYSAVCIGKKVHSDQINLLINENMKLHTNTRNRRFYLLALYSQLESFSNEMFNSNNQF